MISSKNSKGLRLQLGTALGERKEGDGDDSDDHEMIKNAKKQKLLFRVYLGEGGLYLIQKKFPQQWPNKIGW